MPEDVGDGNVTFALFHRCWFLRQGRFTLRTCDTVTVRADPRTGVVVMAVEYPVVDGTGRFAGYGGTFRSQGWAKAVEDGNGPHTVGVARFEGQICRTWT